MGRHSRIGSSCFLLPHGGYALIPTVLTTMAWVCSIFQDGCDYAIIEGPAVQTITGVNNFGDDMTTSTSSASVAVVVPWIEVGFAAYRNPNYHRGTDTWEISYAGSCTNYDMDRVQFDPAWKVAKAFAFLALVLGGGGALFLWFSACCIFSKATWRWAGYEVLLAATFQTLAFLWFHNSLCQSNKNNTCALSWGSRADIAAAVLWAVAALSIFVHYPRSPKLSLYPPPPEERSSLTITTTVPEIAVTDLEGGSQQQQQKKEHHRRLPKQQKHQHYDAEKTVASTTATIQSSSSSSLNSSSSSSYQGSAHVAAALPLEGDATATMSPKKPPKRNKKQVDAYEKIYNGESSNGLKDVEVI